MGKPVSIDMTAFEYVRQGLPNPMLYLVHPNDITPEQWQTLISDELSEVKPILKEMLGFRPLSAVLTKEVEPYTGAIGGYTRELDQSGDFACRMMFGDYIDEPGWRNYFLLDRGGKWIRWRSHSVNTKSGKQATQASLYSLSPGDLLALLRWDASEYSPALLGYNLLKSLVQMVDHTIAELSKRVKVMQNYREVRIGQSLSRINYWK